MSSVSTDDRNVLFGLIALRAEVVTPEALAEAMDGWLKDGQIGIADRLIRKGALRADRRAWIDAMVEVELETPERRAETMPQPPSTMASVAALTVTETTDPTTPLGLSTDATMPFDPPRQQETISTVGSDPRSNSTIIVAPSRFRILRSHARGGLGEVFVARDEELGRDVALKEIQERLAHDSRSRARFLLEAEVTGGLEHPGVVPVYSLGHYPDGRPYYAMRFIKGKSLGEAIEEYHETAKADPGTRPLLLRGLIRRFLDVCNAVDYAHSRGVLHRDLKPGNIMLGKYGETLVVDWGLAKAVGINDPSPDASAEGPLQPASGSGTAETMPGSAIGTPQFMSPEQAAGQLDKIGPASDVYSLGATLYCILTCRAAFEEPDVRVVLHNVQRGVFPAPKSCVPSVPHRLQAICLKAMSLRPEDRYPTVRELADDIEHWLADEPVSAYQENIFGWLARWGRRHRNWVQAGAAALVLVALVATFAAVQISRARILETGERLKVERMTDQLLLNRAVSHFEVGRSGRGMLRLATGLAAMKDNEIAAHAYRANLAVWATHIHPLRQIFDAPDMVLAVAFSHDPTIAIMGGILPKKGTDGGFAQLINARTGEKIGPRILLKRDVSAVAFPPGSSTRFAVASVDGKVSLWERGALTPRLTLAHPEAVWALLFVDGGRSLVTACDDGIVRTWGLADGRQNHPPLEHPRPVRCLASYPESDDAILTGCADGEIRVWNRTSGVARLPTMRLHSEIVGLGVTTTDGTVTAGGRAGEIQTFLLSDGTSQGGPISVETEIATLGLSPDGKTIGVGCEDNLTRLYDRATGTMVGLPLEHRGTVRSLAFGEHEPILLTGCQDDTARVWEFHSRRRTRGDAELHFRNPEKASSATPEPIRTLKFGRDAGTLLVAVSHGVGLIKSPGSEPVGTPISVPDTVAQAALSPDNSRIATVGGPYLRLCPVGAGDGPLRSINLGPGATGTSVSYDPTGRFLAVGTAEHGVRLFDLPGGTPRGEWLDHDGEVRAVAFSDDGRRLLSAGGLFIRVWDVETGISIGTQINHSGPVYDAVFNRDASLVLAGGENNTARYWNPETGTPVGLPLICQGSVMSVAISTDGLTVLTGSEDRTVRLWDSATYLPIGPPYRMSSKVARVAFAPADRSIAAATENGEIRVWNLVPPCQEPPERLVLWAESISGFTFDFVGDDIIGIMRGLTDTDYQRVKKALAASGPPIH